MNKNLSWRRIIIISILLMLVHHQHQRFNYITFEMEKLHFVSWFDEPLFAIHSFEKLYLSLKTLFTFSLLLSSLWNWLQIFHSLRNGNSPSLSNNQSSNYHIWQAYHADMYNPLFTKIKYDDLRQLAFLKDFVLPRTIRSFLYASLVIIIKISVNSKLRRIL